MWSVKLLSAELLSPLVDYVYPAQAPHRPILSIPSIDVVKSLHSGTMK